MLHSLDLVPVRDTWSDIDKPCEAWQSRQSFRQLRVNLIAGAVTAARRGSAGPDPRPRCGRPRRSLIFECENGVLATVARDGKRCIGPRTIVTSRARDLTARHDVLVLAQR